MRNWPKAVLFVSAFSPALISVAISKYLERGYSADVAYCAVSGVAGVCTAFSIILFAKRLSKRIPFTATKIESNDALVLGVLPTYFAPFMTKASDITSGVIIVFFLVGWVVL